MSLATREAPPPTIHPMAVVLTIATQQVVALRRQRTFLILVSTLVAMTVLAGIIGWSSQNTIARVYDEAVLLLADTGQPAPANPVGLKPTLSLLSNMSIYIPLIGALLAIVIGHLTFSDDEAGGIGRLLFSRRVSRSHYVIGRLVGTAAALAAALLASLLVSVIALTVVHLSPPTSGEAVRLLAFYSLSGLYLMSFALVGMITVLLTRSRSKALLSALAVWLVVTFAVPQVVSGLRPVASLNPVNAPASSSLGFFRLTSLFRPLSLAEQYKGVAANILQTTPDGVPVSSALGVLPIMVALVALTGLAVVLVRSHDYSRSVSDE